MNILISGCFIAMVAVSQSDCCQSNASAPALERLNELDMGTTSNDERSKDSDRVAATHFQLIVQQTQEDTTSSETGLPPAAFPPPPAPSRGLTVDSSYPSRASVDWCMPPAGLSIPESVLLRNLGYDPSHCYVYSQQNCFELALACFRRGMMADAIVVAEHGLRHGHNSSLQLIKAAAHVSLGDCLAAQEAARHIVEANDRVFNRSFDIAFERLSGPESSRVMEMIRVYEGW